MQTPAYEKLRFYQNLVELRREIYRLTQPFEKTHPKVVGQARDAIRSAKQNIIEGYRKDTFGDFYRSIKISRGSLGEIYADIRDFYEDRLIKGEDFAKLEKLFQQTSYQIDRYLDSILKLEQAGKWKIRFKR